MSEKNESRTQAIRGYVDGKIQWLWGLPENQRRAELAKLRRGIGHAPGELPDLWGGLLQGMPASFYGTNGPSHEEWAVYLALTLYALHQQSNDTVCVSQLGCTLGRAVRRLAEQTVASGQDWTESSILRRFNALATAEEITEISHHLRGMIQLLRAAKPGAVALGGRLSVQAKTIAQEAGVELVDYFARPELTVYNAIPTAEGCIGILLAERTRTLWGTNLLLLGFGPVGQALGARLAALGANVTVCARRAEQRALAESLGLRGAELARLAALAPAFDTVVNTIPAPVLTEPVLAALRPGSLIVDLASKPGGTDFAAAQRLGCKAIHALSLPAACAPDTAGEAVARTVLTILREREEHT